MDLQKRVDLIYGVGEEVINLAELRELLQTKDRPVAYDGFEPSGIAHLPVGVFRPILLKDMLAAGVDFKLFIADWHGWINNKMGGDLEAIRSVGKYFLEVWKAAGVDMDKVEVIWASDVVADPDYWKKVIAIARQTTLKRMARCLTIMGRKEGELQETSQYFYPAMQCADIFEMGVDICQLGMGQRKINMLARELGPKLGHWKPVCVHHHMLMGLDGPVNASGLDDDTALDVEISSKMSKSNPDSCIYVHDSDDAIRSKLKKAYCPAGDPENPIMDYAKHIVFRLKDTFVIKRPAKFGGDIEVPSYAVLESMFEAGAIHPLDLKNGVADVLIEFITPIREHFEKDPSARKLYELVKTQEITR